MGRATGAEPTRSSADAQGRRKAPNTPVHHDSNLQPDHAPEYLSPKRKPIRAKPGAIVHAVEVPPLSTPSATQSSSALIPDELRAPAPFGASAGEA